MINEANEIERFFEGLGLRIKINKSRVKRRGRQVHRIEVLPGGKIDDLYRADKLLEYYFTDLREVTDGVVLADLNNFKRDGHGDTGTCKLCGCTENDACLDSDGIGCFWVEDDLCSECGTPEQVEKVKLANAEHYRKYAIEQAKKLLGS